MTMRKYLNIAAITALVGCSGVPVEKYAKEKPVLKLEDYFQGKIMAHGIFQDRSGEVTKRFLVTMNCEWKGSEGVLDEDFVYSDGTKSKRIWKIKKIDESTYEGRAADVVGKAIGKVAGNALRWTYVMALEVDGKTYHVDFDDWMYLMDEKVMLNKSKMSKFGVYLGEVTLSFQKP